MKYSFELEVNSTKEKIFDFYKDLNSWNIWEEDLENIKIVGDFITGSTIYMKLKDLPELKMELIDVIENKQFFDNTIMPFGKIIFGHEIIEKNNKIYINHSVELENEITLENIMILKNIFDDVSKSMFLLKKYIESIINSNFKDDSSKSTGYIFIKVYNKWFRLIKKELKKINITHPQFQVLAVIGYMSNQKLEITQIMIANALNMDIMTTSEILRLLEKKELLVRKKHSSDTRAKSIVLNEHGFKKLNESIIIVEKIDEVFFKNLENENNFRNDLLKLSEKPLLY